MSIVSIHSVFCDAVLPPDGEGAGCHGWIAEAESAAAARKVAKRAGWKRTGRRDLCPHCAERS